MAANQDQATNARRILILGSAPHTRLVKAYDWNKLPADLTVSDYDTVIMNFTPFADRDYAAGMNIDRIPSWDQFARHVFSEAGETIVIGSPNFQLGNNPYLTSSWWLPMELNFVYQKGEDIRLKHLGFASYFKLVKSWSFYLEWLGNDLPPQTAAYIRVGAPGMTKLRLGIEPIAETRFQRPVAFRLQLNASDEGSGSAPQTVIATDIYWLPEPTETTAHDSIDMLLRERYHLQFDKEPPVWAAGYILPAELPIREVIRSQETTIAELSVSLDHNRAQLAQAARFTKLLYEQGEDVLEPIVRDALRNLGAHVDDPNKRGREDGRFTDPFDRIAMLEVKGRSGSLRLTDIRELDQWVRDAVATEGWKSKGLLIANLQSDDDPLERKDYIPPNCLETARNFGLCIVTTSQLFRAIVDDQRKQLDRRYLWDVIFATSGLADLPFAEPTTI